MAESERAREVPAYDTRIWLGRSRDYSVVIPVLDEGDRIGRLLERMRALAIHELADIVIVDGGSRDGSLAASRLAANHVRALLVKTGPGRLSAQLRCGYAFSLDQGYAGVVTIDGNDKDDPEAIPRFLRALAAGVDFVQASRYLPGGRGENTPWLRELAIRCVHAPLLRFASGFPFTDTTQGYRAYSAAVLRDPRIAPFRDVFDSYELLAYLSVRIPRLGYRVIEEPTIRRYPESGAVPTKISHVRGNLALLGILLRSCTGAYDPGPMA